MINAICSSAVSLEQSLSAKISDYLSFLFRKGHWAGEGITCLISGINRAPTLPTFPRNKGIYMSSVFTLSALLRGLVQNVGKQPLNRDNRGSRSGLYSHWGRVNYVGRVWQGFRCDEESIKKEYSTMKMSVTIPALVWNCIWIVHDEVVWLISIIVSLY